MQLGITLQERRDYAGDSLNGLQQKVIVKTAYGQQDEGGDRMHTTGHLYAPLYARHLLRL